MGLDLLAQPREKDPTDCVHGGGAEGPSKVTAKPGGGARERRWRAGVRPPRRAQPGSGASTAACGLGQTASAPSRALWRADGHCFPRARTNFPTRTNQLPQKKEPGAANSRNQATGRPPRGAHAHSAAAAGACAVTSRLSSQPSNPTAEGEGRACAKAPLWFLAQSSSSSRRVHLLASVVQHWFFSWVWLKNPYPSHILKRETAKERAGVTEATSRGGPQARPAGQVGKGRVQGMGVEGLDALRGGARGRDEGMRR